MSPSSVVAVLAADLENEKHEDGPMRVVYVWSRQKKKHSFNDQIAPSIVVSIYII